MVFSCQKGGSVHPHARGEHDRGDGVGHDCSGSSPRTWGTLSPFRVPTIRSRFIPTHVGNTTPWGPGISPVPVHPHARGEHGIFEGIQKNYGGSSPRTWGTLRRSQCRALKMRFIPTHVGNTPRRCPGRWRAAVHPHARGEHSSSLNISAGGYGSSPRTWGTHDRLQHLAAVGRFIPTHVGNTRLHQLAPSDWTVHPHARGEHR